VHIGTGDLVLVGATVISLPEVHAVAGLIESFDLVSRINRKDHHLPESAA
jgi:hypothetical protein